MTTPSRKVHFDVPAAVTPSDTAQLPSEETIHPRRPPRPHRKSKRRGMVYGYYVSPSALLANLRKNNAVVSKDAYEVSLDFKRSFCRATNRRGTSTTFVSVAELSGYCVVLSKGTSMETEIQVLKKLLDTEEEPKWYPIDPEP
jgi:hypothetical protein